MKLHPTNMDQKSTKQTKTTEKTGKSTSLGKRFRPSHTDSESDTEQAPTSWPRFLVIKPTNKNTTVTTVSPFAINKALLGIAGEMKSIKKLSNGELMVKTNRKPHSDNLLKCKTLYSLCGLHTYILCRTEYEGITTSIIEPR